MRVPAIFQLFLVVEFLAELDLDLPHESGHVLVGPAGEGAHVPEVYLGCSSSFFFE